MLEYLEIDTRLGQGDPELGRRVRTLRSLMGMLHGFTPATLTPLERLIQESAESGGEAMPGSRPGPFEP